MDSLSNQGYITVKAAAEYLDVSKRLIYEWIRSGRLPAYNIGLKNYRLKIADLNALVQPVKVESSQSKYRRL